MNKLITKLGNTICCQDQDLRVAEAIIKICNAIESKYANNKNLRFVNGINNFEIKLELLSKEEICSAAHEKTLSFVKCTSQEEIEKSADWPAYIAEFNRLAKISCTPTACNNLKSAFYEAHEMPEKLVLNKDFALYISNFMQIREAIEKTGSDCEFTQMLILLHEIAHIYQKIDANGAHGPKFKAACKKIAAVFSQEFWEVRDLDFCYATFVCSYATADLLAAAGIN